MRLVRRAHLNDSLASALLRGPCGTGRVVRPRQPLSQTHRCVASCGGGRRRCEGGCLLRRRPPLTLPLRSVPYRRNEGNASLSAFVHEVVESPPITRVLFALNSVHISRRVHSGWAGVDLRLESQSLIRGPRARPTLASERLAGAIVLHHSRAAAFGAHRCSLSRSVTRWPHHRLLPTGRVSNDDIQYLVHHRYSPQG